MANPRRGFDSQDGWTRKGKPAGKSPVKLCRGQLFACWRLFPSREGEKPGFQEPYCPGDIDFCSASWYDSISELRSLTAKVVRKT
jgi:hypothetical protein